MKKSWDTYWDTFYQNSDGNQYPEVSIVRFVARNYYQVNDKSCVKILNLGCATGAHQWYLAREGFDAYGIDGSPTAVNKTRERLQKEGLQSNLCAGDFLTLPYEDEFMDAVIDPASIQHNSIESIREIIKEVYRVLKNGGRFFGMFIAKHKNLIDAQFKTHFFQKTEIQTLFSGFKSVNIDHFHYSEENEEKYVKFWVVKAQKLKQ